MAIVTMDSAGKVLIPKAIRDHMNLKPGDEVELRVTRDGRVILDKAYANRRAPLTGEPERSALRPGSLVRIRHTPPDD